MSRRPRAPGLVYGGLSLALLAVLSAIAFTTRQPPPPTIAEFAPNAIEQIRDAPNEQAPGQGRGVCPPDQPDCLNPIQTPTPTSLPTPPEIVVPNVKQCAGGTPPRQIQDPQSPPCVPYWAGDNGGSTYPGVTRNEIRIAMPSSCPSVERCKVGEIKDYAAFFNSHFQFYGRKIRIMDMSNDQDTVCDDDDAPGSRNTAKMAASPPYNAFGSIECGSGDPIYSKELARLGRMFVSYESFFGLDTGRKYHPYLWMYPMEPESVFAHMGEWGCKRVVGGRSIHAGPGSANKPRKFGVILTPFKKSNITPDELTNRLRSCGANLGPIFTSEDPDHRSIILKMQNEGVTSIFCLCHILEEASLGNVATTQGYFPEWLVSSYDINYYNHQMKISFPPQQRQHVFGIQILPMQQRTEDWPATWACKEVNPRCDATFPGIGPYHVLLLYASGIQMAGPNLTPETFAEGLRRTIFPNPNHPIIPGKVGFNSPIARPNSSYSAEANMPHGMTTDGIEYWWSESARGPNTDEGNGAMCYVARKRYRLGEYPSAGRDKVFFSGPCDSGGT